MAEESAQNTRSRRPVSRVSMVPIHSSYPRAPYAGQKNVIRTQSARGVKPLSARDLRSTVEEHVPTPPRHTSESTSATPTQRPVNQPNTATQAAPQQQQGRHGRNGQRAIPQSVGQQPRSAQSMAVPAPPAPLSYGPGAPTPTPPPIDAPAPVGLPQGAVYAPGTSPMERDILNRPRQPHRGSRGTDALTSKGMKKAKYTALTIILIVFFFTSILPRIVDVLVPATDAINSSITESDTYRLPSPAEEDKSETAEDSTYYAKDPYAIPMRNTLEIGPPLPPEQPGSRETPAGVGQRVVVNNVAITVLEIEQGQNAARAAWSKAPAGYEYVRVRLQYENPEGVPVTFEPIFLADVDTGIYPQPLKEGLDFRYDAQPDENGIMTGDVLFLARTDEHYTLMMHSFNGEYPIVFYALP